MIFLKKRIENLQKEIDSNKFMTADQRKEEFLRRVLNVIIDFVDETRLRTDLVFQDNEKRKKKQEAKEFRMATVGPRRKEYS